MFINFPYLCCLDDNADVFYRDGFCATKCELNNLTHVYKKYVKKTQFDIIDISNKLKIEK